MSSAPMRIVSNIYVTIYAESGSSEDPARPGVEQISQSHASLSGTTPTGGIEMSGKYRLLTQYLRAQAGNSPAMWLSLPDIERVIGCELPNAAYPSSHW